MIESTVGFSMIGTTQVPHRRTTINGITFDAPARINVTGRKGKNNQYEHEKLFGVYLYAIPGGGTITQDGVVL